MTNKPENPPAFPHTDWINAQGQGQTYEGMTLRDYFAAKAMQGILSRGVILGPKSEIAEHCYFYADAMLCAREGK
jgi:hypothetical protein